MPYFATGAALTAALNALPTSLTGTYKAFDAFYYAGQYMSSYSGTLSPIEHFVTIGAARGYQPNQNFNPSFYQAQYADLAGLDAADLLYHYVTFGLNEGRAGNATLAANDWSAYLAAYPAVAAYVTANLTSFGGSATNGAIAHYVKFGAQQGFTLPNTVGQTFILTAGADTGAAFTGTSGNDTFQGSYVLNGAGNATASFTIGDTINGGAGTDTLKIIKDGAIVAGDVAPVGATLTSIENLEIISGAGLTAVLTTGSGLSGVTQVTSSSVGASALTAAATQNVTMGVTGAVGAADAISLNGGLAVSVTATDTVASTATADGITIGATTAATGAVTVTNTVTSTDETAGGTTSAGAIAVTGGTTVNVTQTMVASAAAIAAVRTGNLTTNNTQGQIDVTGSSATTAVTVVQSAAVTAVASATAGVSGLINGAVNILDVNRTSATAAGTITTATVTNAGATTVNSGALNTLNLGGTLTTVNAGTLGALTTPANTALTVNLTGAVSTGALTVDTDITTINISGAGTANTLADLVNASATAVNISGTAGVTITANTLAGAAVITSTNSAGTTLTQALGVNQQFVGGAGADSVSVAATTKAINMGDGNDTVIISTETLGTGGTINGGAGTNTIVANTNGSTLSANANITGFTTLRVAGAAAQGAHNATGFTALEVGLTGTNLAGAMSFTNVAAGTTLTYRATTGQTSAYTLANATGTSDVLNLTLSSAANINTGALTAAGIETVNITNTDTTTTTASGINTNTMTLTAAAATTINVTGNAGLALTATGSTAVTTFNASGVTGLAADAAALAVTYASLNATRTAAVAITGGSGNDTLTGNAAIDTINGGLGNDIIDGGTGADVIDGGAGTNTFVAVAAATATVEGVGTGTTDGMAINLGTTAVTAATINAAMGGTIGLSAASASLAAGTAQYIFATQSNLFATTTDTLANIQNVTGTASNDYIVGSTANNVINAGDGIDQIILGTATVGGSDTVRIASAAAANRDIISGFTAGAVTATGQADVININTALATLTGTDNFTTAAAIQTSGAAGNKTAAAATEVIYVSAATIADATSANSLDGTNVLAAMGGTLTGAIAGQNNLLLAVGIAGGGTAIYYANSANDAIIAAEISLVGVLSGVAVADLVFSNFSNVA